MVDGRLRFVRLQIGWMAATVLLLTVVGAFSLELFYVVSLIGYFVLYEVTAADTVRPRWRRRLGWVSVLWLVGFVAVVAYRVVRIVSDVA